MTTHFDVIVAGAGAAGLMAAARAAERGRRTLLLEKNTRPGLKILMSGGTRCNITQNTDNRGIIRAYGSPGKFLHSALAAFGVREAVEMFESEGVKTKVEETNKIFPVSNDAADVLDALVQRVERAGCKIAYDEPLADLKKDGGGFLLKTSSRELRAASVILTTGGKSYPGSGTTGDGYAWAAGFGHTIVPPRPALTPIVVSAEWPRALKGLTLPDVGVRIVEPALSGKASILDERRGSFLFTHFGLSGPAILDASRAVSGHMNPNSLLLECDFLPAMKEPAVEQFLKDASTRDGKKQLETILCDLAPRRLAEQILRNANIDGTRRMGELSKADRQKLVEQLKRTRIAIFGVRGFGKAEVTAGGVSLDEVNSSTMESKLCPGLFFAGEILDLDGPIGGYNFQAAWSTGYLAGDKA